MNGMDGVFLNSHNLPGCPHNRAHFTPRCGGGSPGLAVRLLLCRTAWWSINFQIWEINAVSAVFCNMSLPCQRDLGGNSWEETWVMISFPLAAGLRSPFPPGSEPPLSFMLLAYSYPSLTNKKNPFFPRISLTCLPFCLILSLPRHKTN